MHRNFSHALSLSLLLICLSTAPIPAPLAAEMERAPDGRALLSLSLPVKGMLMQQVEAEFGPPMATRPPVGHPPISVWFYNDFSVYFEHQHVIHAVLNSQQRRPTAPLAPQPAPMSITPEADSKPQQPAFIDPNAPLDGLPAL